MDDKNVQKSGVKDKDALPYWLHVQLNFNSGPDLGMVKRLRKKTTVLGRSDCDIIISDPAASKNHVEISYEKDELILRDMGSENGTVLDNGQVFEAVLENLDTFVIGDTAIQVTILKDVEAEEVIDPPEGAIMVDSKIVADTTLKGSAISGKDSLMDPLPKGVNASLLVAIGPDTGQRFKIKKRGTIIGRADADMILSDPRISRRHASIEFLKKNKIILKDLRSTNGTYLSRRRITIANLKGGESIQAGDTVINFLVSTDSSSDGY
jgi:pSer/pThr/pTyr-binding forkhead associated (FHA) protein